MADARLASKLARLQREYKLPISWPVRASNAIGASDAAKLYVVELSDVDTIACIDELTGQNTGAVVAVAAAAAAKPSAAPPAAPLALPASKPPPPPPQPAKPQQIANEDSGRTSYMPLNNDSHAPQGGAFTSTVANP